MKLAEGIDRAPGTGRGAGKAVGAGRDGESEAAVSSRCSGRDEGAWTHFRARSGPEPDWPVSRAGGRWPFRRDRLAARVSAMGRCGRRRAGGEPSEIWSYGPPPACRAVGAGNAGGVSLPVRRRTIPRRRRLMPGRRVPGSCRQEHDLPPGNVPPSPQNGRPARPSPARFRRSGGDMNRHRPPGLLPWPPNDPGDHSRPFRGPAVRAVWGRGRGVGISWVYEP